ncbi:10797_t:CDS:2 [Paraglomus occultum]|uniref:10797_t:CDS:1 n=1 Tax=Paraglomus occultum TaxID=144539 RepID=A0A9N9H0B9_9GLOM|nr:10797_t:CDS:2 [Paraglomus occultum]
MSGDKQIQVAVLGTLILNSLACVCVFCKTACRWRDSTSKEMPIVWKVSLYTATLDFMLCIIMMLETVSPKPHMGQSFMIMKGIALVIISMSMFMGGTMIVLTYLNLCKKMDLDLGRHDWKLFASVMGASLPLSFTAWSIGHLISGWIITLPVIVVFVSISITALLVLYCYVNTLNVIYKVGHDLLGSNMASQRTVLEKAVSKKLSYYLWVFFCRVLLLVGYIITLVNKSTDATVSAIILLGLSIGVSFNVIFSVLYLESTTRCCLKKKTSIEMDDENICVNKTPQTPMTVIVSTQK